MSLAASVLVVHGDSFIALSIVRSIGRRGVPVAVLFKKAGIAAMSRYCSYAERYSAADDVVEKVIAIVREKGLTHVIATSEDIIRALNARREEIEHYATLLFPQAKVFNRALHKEETLAIAEAIGVPCPRTVKVRIASDLNACADLRFPVAVKSQRGIADFKVEYFDSLARLSEFLEPKLGGETFLVQEYIKGAGVGIEVLMRGGKPLLVFSHKRIREFPPTGGVSTCCEGIEPDPALLDYSVRLLQAMEWDGVAMVEFKVNRQTKQTALMEVNGRFWGSLPLAIQSGADFPYELVRTDVEKDASVVASPRAGKRCRLLVSETKWLYGVLRDGKTPKMRAVVQYLGGFKPSMGYYCFSADDVKPAVSSFASRLAKLTRRTRSIRIRP